MAKDKKILLVEDDSFLREIIFKRLAKEGFVVTEAEDGEKALLAVDKEKFDLILLDILLPSINGFEVLQKIRSLEDENAKKVPVIMLSNLGEETDIKKAMEFGANNYLVKAHFTTEEIIEKIREELGE
ncbi:MAG: response regulator [Patescibacteria group bacterium]|nr:response regulator [Patescibacteria group bacterium]MDD4611344.1 response regulator [Patescibacteria group bacterium]